MPPLDSYIRDKVLEKSVLRAREAAEESARVALTVLAVDRPDRPTGQSDERKQLRRALRARARQLGGPDDDAMPRLLVEEVAYEQWHQMLFARFLSENNLLMHPKGGAVTLEECAELAPSEGEPDRWQLAARYASAMLPGIFRSEDPSHQVRLAPEGRAALEAILAELPTTIFTSDDGLGWVYQFWQTKRKKEVGSNSGTNKKIEKLDLAAYSQLFTEHYMVQFLLENSLGAWWATHHPESPLVKEFQYLRTGEGGTPAAGTFLGWPERASEITVMDPCCGSGHFLVVAFDMLRRMRMEEEALSAAEAAAAVLKENLFGLELDPRCLQIAAFALALAVWKVAGYRRLPPLNLGCSGIPVTGQLEEWTKLAQGDPNLGHTLERLFQLFKDAPDLGSLINPADVPVRDRMFAPDFGRVQPLLERALAREKAADPVSAVFGEAAQGIARAAELLARQYTLVATNVPYLARGKQGETLKSFVELRYGEAKADLATAFVQRCRAFAANAGSYALVTPHNWLFLGSYKKLREAQLAEQAWNVVARMGPGAFETISGEVVNVALTVTTNARPAEGHTLAGIDASAPRSPQEKAAVLREGPIKVVAQADQLSNMDARIVLRAPEIGSLLLKFASSHLGLGTGDAAKYLRFFWEIGRERSDWAPYQIAVQQTQPFGGLDQVIAWNRREGRVRGMTEAERVQVHNQDKSGSTAWSKKGVAVALMRRLPSALYEGAIFDKSMAVLIPADPVNLPALWAYCSSTEFHDRVRDLDQKMIVANGTLVKVPFELARWQQAAVGRYPDGLPQPHSDDPTQWLFKGNPVGSVEPLQVAAGRLLGYRWPQQEADRLDRPADGDGIVPLVPMVGKEPAESRLRDLLAAAYGSAWAPDVLQRLLDEAGFGSKGLGAWLRDGFFEQHCRLYHQRPFIWQIWDETRDGFSILVNYHKLDSAHLDRLIYTYLGEWIQRQRNARDADEPGAEGRLVAALKLQEKLKAIQEGEPPYDIYVRWKPLHRQPIGWDPDLDDGVRLNIRPFVLAGVLRGRVNASWGKDRGANPDGTERINERHLTVAEKTAARKAVV